MPKFLIATFAALGLLAASPAFAAEKTVTLAVRNMDCAACPYIVEGSLKKLPGVKSVKVSFEDKTAVVIYDDEQTDVKALTEATRNAGYPSSVKA